MPRSRGKDASNKTASTGTQPEEGEYARIRERAPERQGSRQDKRRDVAAQLQKDADENHFDSLNAHAQSVGKHPKGKP